MRVQHNIPALKANANRNKIQGQQATTLQRLSSGFRINRAADDAAGLGISEKLRALITGTERAEENVNDGISMVQTADGAMAEVHAILNRCLELGTQASNGIYGPDERTKMQAEINQLTEEIGRIAEHTNFNGLKILQGNRPILEEGGVTVIGGLPAWVGCDPSVDVGYMTSVYTTTETYQAPDGTTASYPINHVSAEFDFSAYTGTPAQKAELDGQGVYFTCCTCDRHYSIEFTSGTDRVQEVSGNHYIYKLGIDNLNTSGDLVQAVIGIMDNGNPNHHYTKLIADTSNPGKLIIYDDRSSEANPATPPGGTWPGWSNPSFHVTADEQRGKVGKGVAVDSSTVTTMQEDVVLQIGPMTDDRLKINLADARINAIGIQGISVMTAQAAQQTIPTIKAGIEHISSERGRMGAYQNRLEHTKNVLVNSHENLQSAESQIRDTDMAGEMMAYVKQQILTQSSTVMLGQANLRPQTVLELLR